MMDKNKQAKTGFWFRFLVDFSFAHFSDDMGLVGIYIYLEPQTSSFSMDLWWNNYLLLLMDKILH